MSTTHRPLNPIVPPAPEGDRRPTLMRPAPRDRGMFSGWGPKL